MTQRIPFGLDRLPRNLSHDDPRLPGVTVGAGMLRFNTEPLPPEASAAATPDHAARVTSMKQFLFGLCGDYAPLRQRFIDVYIDALATHIAAHREELARGLAQYDGLYMPEDWLWSAPRPLPRAWVKGDAGLVAMDIAFWDGARAIGIDLTGTAKTSGLAICRITPDMLQGGGLLAALPATFQRFWTDETLPRSPFRRAIPSGVLNVTAAAFPD
jgi:hypothetical protein